LSPPLRSPFSVRARKKYCVSRSHWPSDLLLFQPFIRSLLQRKPIAEHRPPALGFGLRRFVLNHVPMLDQESIDHTNEVRNDPVLGLAEARKATVHDHVLAVRHNLL